MKNLINITIKIIACCFLIAFLNSCFLFQWEKEDDYWYAIGILNKTNDTLSILLGYKHTVFDKNSIYPDTIPPFDTLYFGGMGIDEGLRIERELLYEEPTWDTVHVYRHDTLKAAWFGPGREMPDSTHNFFNYNSWESWLIDDNEGIVMFTIYPEDLVLE